VDAALIGTAREPAGPGRGLPALEQVALGQIAFEHADDQVRLLDSAAATSRVRRAGYRPPLADARTAPAPAEPDPRPEVSLAAQQRVGELLVGGSHELVAEWLRLLAATPWRPPDALLPVLLTLASGNRVVRAALTPVLGPLAAWLAAFNDAWAWAAGVDNSKKRVRLTRPLGW
jgi:hypothetical protein